VSLEFFGHPFSSYTQKALIALYADGTEFEYRRVPDNEENYAELKRIWPLGKFPVLLDDGQMVVESTPIIEHLQACHSGPNRWIPDEEEGRRVRFLDRFFDLHVMTPMQRIVAEHFRPQGSEDPFGVEQARAALNTAYDWLESVLPGSRWGAGDDFTLVDCAAAPSLFYADWVEEIGDQRPELSAYRARLLAHPVVARVVDEARPYRELFPPGAPDRD
jgi:glutathione S-transferase